MLPIPQHPQNLRSIFGDFSHLCCHFIEPCGYKSLFILKFFCQRLLTLFYVLVLSLEPNDKILDLLLLRQHVLISSVADLEQRRIQLVIPLVYLFLLVGMGHLVDDVVDGWQV